MLFFDFFGFDAFGHHYFLLLDGLLDLFDVVELLAELAGLLPLPRLQLRLSLLFVAVADGHLGQLCLGLHLAGVGLGALEIYDPFLQFLQISLPGVIGVPGLRGDD